MEIKGGYTNYGELLGILMLDTQFARPVGDIGNARTFSFPVKYKKVKNASPGRIVKEADVSLLQPFIDSAKELEESGVKAVTTSCGFLAMFQKELAASVNIPVFTSSLIQVPFAYKLMGCRGKVGILTARKSSLSDKHIWGVDMENIPFVICGMDDSPEFSEVFLGEKVDLDYKKCEKEMQEKALELVKCNPDVNVIILECTNMPPFRNKIQEVVQRPVLDIVTLVNYIYLSIQNL